jgi:myo-inositol-1-phosphate synthase
VLEDPGSFKSKEETKLSVLDQILQPKLYPELYKDLYHAVRINYYPPRGDSKGRLGQHRHFRMARLSDADQDRFPVPRFHSGRSAGAGSGPVPGSGATLRHARHSGMAVLLLQSAHDAPGLYPEHDIFIQLMKLKNTLRWMRGEDLITHLGLEYYD